MHKCRAQFKGLSKIDLQDAWSQAPEAGLEPATL